jgi:hypothetical protein
MNENIDRKMFEEMITPQVDRIRALLIDTLEKSGKLPKPSSLQTRVGISFLRRKFLS